MDDMNQLAQRLAAIPERSASYDWLASWVFPYPSEQEDLLTTVGMREHAGLGERFRLTYGESFPDYSPLTYDIRHTCKSRTGRSGASFVSTALAGSGTDAALGMAVPPVFMSQESDNEDSVLRFLHNCPAYSAAVTDNATAYAEYDKFLSGPDMAAAASAAAAILTDGKVSTGLLSSDDMLTVFAACAYDVQLESTEARWCSLLDDGAVNALNYANDLEDWVQRGPAVPVTSRAATLLLADVLGTLRAAAAGGAGAAAHVWRFAHDSTLLPLATLLGLFDGGQPLTGEAIVPDRAFRTSIVTSFAANAAFVLFECGGGEHLVGFQYNEVDSVLPGCEDHGNYCPLDVLLEALSERASLDYGSVCGGACECDWA